VENHSIESYNLQCTEMYLEYSDVFSVSHALSRLTEWLTWRGRRNTEIVHNQRSLVFKCWNL